MIDTKKGVIIYLTLRHGCYASMHINFNPHLINRNQRRIAVFQQPKLFRYFQLKIRNALGLIYGTFLFRFSLVFDGANLSSISPLPFTFTFFTFFRYGTQNIY